MTAPEPTLLARLHAACFETPRPWSAAEFAALLDDAHVFLVNDPAGFALGRAVAGEAELLTMAVDSAQRRRGHGRRLLARFLAAARARGAAQVFLEVAADNAPAIALYRGAGFVENGRRRDYYRPAGGGVARDALILCLPPGEPTPPA